jgi:2-polyprenyl-3-methyl-5-hydroxy-6-metoxy-1,4-benzoquinol methylase
MDRKQYTEIIGSVYTDWKSYHADDYNKSGLWPWEADMLERYFSNCKTILVGAAGGGREILSLAARGFQVDGFDCFPEFLDTSQAILSSKNVSAHMILAAPDHVPETFGVYDGGIMGWSGYSHISGTQNRVIFLKEFRQHIQKGGPLLISFFTLPEDSYQFKLVYLTARAVRALRFSREKVERGDILLEMYFHYASQDEVRQEMEKAGFEMAYYSVKTYGHAVGIAV